MSDDLGEFFNKKKSKKRQGVVAARYVQNPDELARRLERTVKQEDSDHETEPQVQEVIQPQVDSRGQLPRQSDTNDQRPPNSTANAENTESEWLEVEEPQEIDMKSLNLKELDIEDNIDNGSDDEELIEKPKTWKLPNSQAVAAEGAGDVHIVPDVQDAASATPSENNVEKPPDNPNENKTEEAAKPARFVPSRLLNRENQSGGGSYSHPGRKPNLDDVNEFPTLACADERIEQEQKRKARLQAQARKSPATPGGPSHYSIPSALKTSAPSPEPLKTNPNAYRPPALRK